MNETIKQLPKIQVESICRKHHIRRLSLFGSALHGDNTTASDLDLLIEFEDGHTPGFAFAGIQHELSEILGQEVDLHTPTSLSKYFRNEVVREAHPLYDASKP